ncbi:hypothetical protein I4U23_003608 [Adineta vaga]|nr:hypothetical protein I4U23_003608 [Adineta vaga]
MDLSNEVIRSYYMDFFRCAGCSQGFEYEILSNRPITLPICGHTMCKGCIDIIHSHDQRKCPQDEILFGINHTTITELPINYSLLMILYHSSKKRYKDFPSYIQLDNDEKSFFKQIEEHLGELILIIKRIINDNKCLSKFSHSTIRKIFSLLNSQYINHEGRLEFIKRARSLGEHICIDFILLYQNLQVLKTNLALFLGLQDGQFLEPDMQEKVLKLILLYLRCDGIPSEKHLIHSIVQKIQGNNPGSIKPSIELIVHLLIGVPCFQIIQVGNSPSIQLIPEFGNYARIRHAYNSSIIQMTMNNGFSISSEKWSTLLYGNIQHDSMIRSIMDEFSTLTSFNRTIEQFQYIIQCNGNPSEHLLTAEACFIYLSQINSCDATSSSWSAVIATLKYVKRYFNIFN